MDSGKRYTMAEAAEKLGVSVTRARGIRQQVAARSGEVGTRFGRAWMLTDADIERMRQRDTTPGPKPKSTPPTTDR